jgi:YbbR domain-containing protein
MKRKSTISDWFSSNAAFQVLAVLLALLAWVFVNSGRTIEQKREVRLQYLQVPKGLVFHRVPLKEFKVDLSGSLYRLRTIKDEDLVYVVDLSQARAGANRVEVDLDNMRLPLDVEAMHPNPKFFYVHLEEVYVRSLPIKPIYLGALREGFAVSEIRTSPESITLTGPRSVVSKLENVEIEIPVAGKDSSFSLQVKPKINLPNTEAVDSVLVEVDVSPIRSARELTNIPVVAEGATEAGQVKISPTAATVSVEGNPGAANSLGGQLKVVIPVEGLKRGRYRMRGRVDLPPSLKLVKIEPQTFIVEVLR